jgi:hypothetical protein
VRRSKRPTLLPSTATRLVRRACRGLVSNRAKHGQYGVGLVERKARRVARRSRRLGARTAWEGASLGTTHGSPVTGPPQRARTAAYGGAGEVWRRGRALERESAADVVAC